MSAIDYDLRKIKAFAFDVDGVLSPSTIPLSPEGEPLRMVNIKDGYALQLAVKLGFHTGIFTGGKSAGVKVRYEGLGIRDIFMGTSVKLPLLKEWMEKNALLPEEVIYMGDDIPDLPALRYVGLPCAPQDAVWEVKETSRYISRFSGGYGCVRDIIEQTLKAQELWLNDKDAFGW